MALTVITAIAQAILDRILTVMAHAITATDIAPGITAEAGEAMTGPAIGEGTAGKVMAGKAQAMVGRDRAGGDGAGRVQALEVAGGVRAPDAAFEVRDIVES